MRISSFTFVLSMLISFTGLAQQRLHEREAEFLTEKPLIGEPLPDVTIFRSDGSEFRTADLRGHYTVLTFGCLTCPPSIWNIPGLEAVERDYGPRGVHFYFVYKSLAHPELAGGFVQPFTLQERLQQASEAGRRFGTKIPWVVDAMDDRFKHAMGDRPNSQFLIDPNGIIVRKRAWSNPIEVRRDLTELVGPTDHVTKVSDLNLRIAPAVGKSAISRGSVERVVRPRMMALSMKPVIDSKGPPFFAKLRVEADPDVLLSGNGQLYVGFHLDPLLKGHWNNLTKPLTCTIDADESIDLSSRRLTAQTADATDDVDPREFMLTVAGWQSDQPLKLTVNYFACVGEEECHAVTQTYTVRRERDADAGGARGEGAGFWDAAEFTKQLMRGDQNKDQKLTLEECAGIVKPHFDTLDDNGDEFLDMHELRVVAEWLNKRHLPAGSKN